MTAEMEQGAKVPQKRSWFEEMLFFPNTLVVACLVAMMLITSTDVVLRFLFRKPIVGSAELIMPLMICAGFLGMAWCAWQDAHVKVDLLAQNLPPAAQKGLRLVNYVIVALLTALMGIKTVEEAVAVRQIGVASDLLRLPEYPFYLVIAASYLLVAAATAVLAVRTALGGRAK
ncbi:MAG: TRAP transporter small permease [Moorellales bacterium]